MSKPVKQPTNIFLFDNGNVAATGDDMQQIPTLQGYNLIEGYFDFLESKGIEVEKIPRIHAKVNGRLVWVRPKKLEDGSWSLLFEPKPPVGSGTPI